MKPATVAALCALSAMLAAAAGAWGGMAFDKRTGDLNGVNAQMNEVASQLKLMSTLLFQLKQGHTAEVDKLVRQNIELTRSAIERGRSHPGLTAATETRMSEAVDLSRRATGP